jgi:hypothetical protein
LAALSVAAAAAAAVTGAVVFAWATELIPLDAALTPILRPFGVVALLAPEEPVETLRQHAKDAAARGDLVLALVTWERVGARDTADPRARTEAAGLRQKLAEAQRPLAGHAAQ